MRPYIFLLLDVWYLLHASVSLNIDVLPLEDFFILETMKESVFCLQPSICVFSYYVRALTYLCLDGVFIKSNASDFFMNRLYVAGHPNNVQWFC